MTTDPYNPLVQDLKPLNEVKYAARDYPSIFDSLLRRLKIEYSGVYNDYATTSQGIMLVELMAYATSQLQFYLDRTASDCFLETARTRAAIARLVKQIGYKMGAASAASTTMNVTFPNGTTGPFVLSARWQFLGPDNLIFESYSDYTQPVALAAGSTIEIPVRQGETRLLSYTADGSKNQQYRLTNIKTDRYLGDGTVDTWVDGLLWDENEFLEFEKTNQYEVGYNDDPPTVQFGDGIAGNVPPEGADVKIRFVILDGEKGNVKANTITESVDTLFVGGEAVTMTVTNPTEARGGQGPEDVDRARRLAPFYFAARGAAITAPDYEALSESYNDPTYGTVAKSFAYNPRERYSDSEFNALSDDVDNALSNYRNGISPYSSPGADGLETAVNTKAAELVDPIAGITSDLADMESLRLSLETYIGTAIAECDSARELSLAAESSALSAADSCQDANTEIGNLDADIVASSLSPSEQTAFLDRSRLIAQHVNLAYNSASSARSSAAGSAASSSLSINSALNPSRLIIIDPSPSGAPSITIPSVIADMTVDLNIVDDAVNDSTTGLVFLASSISGQAALLETNVHDIAGENGSMQDRIGDLFNADCLSNYVQVPILTLDSDGNYAAPSVGLVAGLQTYLEGIKEVTQHVEVVDGSFLLVPAEIEIVLEVNKAAYIESEVVSDVVATILGMLKKRNFNDPLYLSDLYENVMDVSTGIVRVNIEITGPSADIDDENLVPATNKVVTFGSLLIKDKEENVLYSG